nr:RNA-directed DNA polymerase, eukaryota, reverse transcriptase zinc-binding domain protein [Tanacetum cinerariifolium]
MNGILLNREFTSRISLDQAVDLESAVSKEEIKRAVWDCGIDKSPGPDRFTFGFYRRYWNLIEGDVVNTVTWFFHHGRIPNGGNSSFITLIPKIPNANMVKDFRHISLTGSVYKIVAKVLVNRLVIVLGDLVSDTQSAFVKDRQILDDPFILNELVQWCKKKRKQSMIFKLTLKKLMTQLDTSISVTHLSYADDAIFMGQWNRANIDTITRVLDVFHRASGLRINMNKSKLMGISVESSKVEQAVEKIGGLGVASLFALNRSFMFKWVWRFITHKKSLWARVIKAIHGDDGKIGKKFHQAEMCDGTNTSFWNDAWRGDVAFKDLMPRLYMLENMKDVQVATKLSHEDLEWSFRQGSGDFSVSSVRKVIDAVYLPRGSVKTRWIKEVSLKINIHAWKITNDYLPTRFNLSRRDHAQDYEVVGVGLSGD